MGKKKQNKKQKLIQKQLQKQSALLNVQKQQQRQEQSEQQQNFQLNQQILDQQNEEAQFVFVEPNLSHYHSLKSLLQPYSSSTNNKVHEFSDLISSTKQFGIVILTDQQPEDKDFETAFSILTIVPIKLQVTLNIKDYFLKYCKNHYQSHKEVSSILQEESVSLLVNQRFINLPPKLVPLQHQTLKEQYNTLQKTNSKYFKQIKSKYLMVLSQVGKPKEKEKKSNLEDLVYRHFQDYQFLKVCSHYWIFPSNNKLIGKQHSYNLHYIILTQSYLEAIANLAQHVE